MVTVVAAVTLLLRAQLALPDVVMIYLLVVTVVAARWGRAPSLLAAALSVAAYDFFFIPPFFRFAVADLRHLFTFAMMLTIGAIMGGLTDRLRKEEREARAAILSARTEAMRSSLLSSISHDLRTPLATITGAATTLRDDRGAVDREQRSELVATICEEAERLERLVANLLDMTRLEAGQPVRREWVPLDELVASASMRLERELGERTVTVEVAGDVPLAHVDPVLFEQLLVNLLDNAAKHTPSHTPVEIRVSSVGGDVVVELADRGPGIAPGDEDRLFGRFERGRSAPPGGVGLGLAICRAIAEAHGGAVTAENRTGGGAVFRVTLPHSATDAPSPHTPEMAPEEVS
jgi:two-component system sensor histidine kinase KdpD